MRARPTLMAACVALVGCAGAAPPAPVAPAAPPPAAAPPSADAAPSADAPATRAEPGVATAVDPVKERAVLALHDGITSLFRAHREDEMRRAGVHPARPTLAPVAFDIASLPEASLPSDELSDEPPAALPPPAVEAPELVKVRDFGSMVSLTLERQRPGWINIGSEASHRHGTFITCGEGGVEAARWELLEPAAGGARLVVVDGWFDRDTCTASAQRVRTIALAPVADGAAFAFRATADGDPTGSTHLVLLMPGGTVQAHVVGAEASVREGPMTRVVLPIRRGGGGVMQNEVDHEPVARWRQALGSRTYTKRSALLGVEVAQGVGDGAPTGLAYVGPADGGFSHMAVPARRESASTGVRF